MHKGHISLNAMMVCGLIVGGGASASLPGSAYADSLKVVVFDIEPVELAETPWITGKVKARLKTYSNLVRKLFADKGYQVVDLAPQAKKIEDASPLSQCNGCDQDIAKALGADLEVTTAVQPSSSVIFSLSGNVKDVETNRVLREGVVDIRGEGDDVWSHGMKFLVKERLTDPPLPSDAASLRKMVESAPKAEQ